MLLPLHWDYYLLYRIQDVTCDLGSTVPAPPIVLGPTVKAPRLLYTNAHHSTAKTARKAIFRGKDMVKNTTYSIKNREIGDLVQDYLAKTLPDTWYYFVIRAD